MISSIIQGIFKKLKFNPIWVSNKRNDKESLICLTPKPSQSFFVYCKQSKENFFFTEKELFKKKGEWKIETKNEKKSF